MRSPPHFEHQWRLNGEPGLLSPLAVTRRVPSLCWSGIIERQLKQKVDPESHNNTQDIQVSITQITRQTKNQEDLKLNEKRQSVDANTEVREMLEVFDKGFKAAVIKTASTNNHKYTSNNRKHWESEEVEDIKKNQMEFLELKNAITEVTQWMSSIAEWKDRKSVNWKTEQ